MERKITLSEKEIPDKWYNITADMPNKPLPPLNPGTMEPIGPEALAPLFPMELIKQEVTTEKYVDIPDEVRNIYSMWRPTPMYRAYNLEKMLDTPAKIYYKYEGVSPTGSHKPNTAVPQAYYSKQEGVKKITTETGAGQWGSALSFACQHFDIECEVFMVKLSFLHKPYRKVMMNTWGATVHPSPSNETEIGRKILAENPDIVVVIEGHTDNVPFSPKEALESNWDLSTKRATAVVKILLNNESVLPQNLTAAGRSEYVPIAPNNNATGRAVNRRIEIILSPQWDEINALLNN